MDVDLGVDADIRVLIYDGMRFICVSHLKLAFDNSTACICVSTLSLMYYISNEPNHHTKRCQHMNTYLHTYERTLRAGESFMDEKGIVETASGELRYISD